jgi:hypothetical protein
MRLLILLLTLASSAAAPPDGRDVDIIVSDGTL